MTDIKGTTRAGPFRVLWRGLCLEKSVAGFVAFLLSSVVSSAEPALTLTVTAKDLVPAGPGSFIAGTLVSPKPGGLPVVDLTDADPILGNLRRLAATGEAQGFAGIVYENRDRGHSRLPFTDFPALTWLRYSDELQRRGLDYGLAGTVITGLVTFGNSSTAITRPRVSTL